MGRGSETQLQNDNNFTFKLISLLPSIFKLFEKVIYQQLYKYFEDSNLFYESQYGFRKGHSTELASLELVNRLLSKMDKGEVPLAIFIDLSQIKMLWNNREIYKSIKICTL